MYCGCGKKLMFERPRNHQGVAYDYFTCTGRRFKRNNCQRTAVLTHRVEQAIEAGYQDISLSPGKAAQVQGVLGQVFDTLAESTSDEKKLLAGQKAKLEAEQVKLLQAHYADAIPLDLLKTEQDRIRASLQAITGRLDTLETTYDKAKVGLDAILGLLTDIGDVYAKAEPSERQMLNRALFDRITIDDEDDTTLQPTEAIQTILATGPRRHNERTLPRDDAGQGSNVQLYLDAGGLKPNTWQRLERLSSAWNQAKLLLGDEPDGAVDDEPGVVANPRRRARTPLTESQVDAIRTARANGESVVSICRRFNVHRMTVWTHTKDLVAQTRPTRRTPEVDIVDTSILRRN
ncbi:helix-turn-helix domain-containing protein [Corynebacterium pseudodiphtheriticum]|uniref:helix-turn-helix domain-containing protein n=1 Tax=Corynebacterium pseudodiphtheriticum TaxID=37637 RepID=UPI0032B7FB50